MTDRFMFVYLSCKIDIRIAPRKGSVLIGAFDSCEKLRYIRLSQSLKLIACGAFSGCKALESLILPAGLEMIEVNAFEE